MARRCDICGKGVIFGNSVSHSHRLTRRKWRPNLHPVTATLRGKRRRVKLCTRCLRRVRKAV